jgi:hypothetical protein
VPASTARAFHETELELARLFEKYFCGDKPSLAIDLTGAVSCSRRLPYGEIAATCKRFAACAKAPSIRIAEVILIAQACSLFHNGNFGLVGQSLTLLGTILSANPGHAMSLAPWNEAVRLLGLLEVRIPGLAAEYAQPKEIISRAKPVAATSKVTTGSLTTTVTSTTTATTTVTTPAAATGPRPKTDVPFEVRERIQAEYLLQPGGGIPPAAT